MGSPGWRSAQTYPVLGVITYHELAIQWLRVVKRQLNLARILASLAEMGFANYGPRDLRKIEISLLPSHFMAKISQLNGSLPSM